MDINLFEENRLKSQLKPLTFLRHISQIRVGIFTIEEKWKQITGENITVSDKPLIEKLNVNASVLPSEETAHRILNLKIGEALYSETMLIAVRGVEKSQSTIKEDDLKIVDYPWKIFQMNAGEIHKDFARITDGRTSMKVQDDNTVIYNPANVFIEEGVNIKSAIINAENGPVYLGKNSTVSPGSVINGSFALLNNSIVGIGAKLRGDTTVGPWCKVAGEVTNSVIFGYSNKGHEGYLGNSVIAEWCNIGADTNTSNMKNDYSEIRLWDYESGRFKYTGLQFMGLIMGDHSKCGINTMFNSGTSVGVGCSLFGAGYMRNFIPSLTEGGPQGYRKISPDKFLEVARRVMKRRGLEPDESLSEKIERLISD